jgi:hypothetical protein
MALTAVATLLQTLQATIVISAGYGIVAQADGSYVAGVSEGTFNFPPTAVGTWYRSTNNGTSWSQIGTSSGFNAQTAAFPTNIQSNIICIGAESPATQIARIQRSTNFGASWTDVFSVGPSATPPSRIPFIAGVQSFNLTKAIAWGQLDGLRSNPAMLYGISTDAGASFTGHSTFDAGDGFDLANACGIADDSTIYLQYTKRGGVNRTSHFARSDDGGSTWTTLGTPPGGTGTPTNTSEAICCFTKEAIALGGQIGTNPVNSIPALWWSDDAGATLHLLSSSDVANWPSGSFSTRTDEIKRLTRDAAILAIDRQAGGGGSPWRISLDQGHTYPIEVTLSAGSWEPFQSPTGKIVVTRTGRILAPLKQSPDGTDWTHSIFGIDVIC